VWAIRWSTGTDAGSARGDLAEGSLARLASSLGEVVVVLGKTTEVDVPLRAPGSRGGPLGPLIERLHGWLDDPDWNARTLMDVAAVRRLAAEANELVDEPVQPQFVHGDLIPGNLLVDGGRLTAIIDWGGADTATLRRTSHPPGRYWPPPSAPHSAMWSVQMTPPGFAGGHSNSNTPWVASCITCLDGTHSVM
jgi:hypothetical protein